MSYVSRIAGSRFRWQNIIQCLAVKLSHSIKRYRPCPRRVETWHGPLLVHRIQENGSTGLWKRAKSETPARPRPACDGNLQLGSEPHQSLASFSKTFSQATMILTFMICLVSGSYAYISMVREIMTSVFVSSSKTRLLPLWRPLPA